MLDFGCGSLRLGRLLILFLNDGRYFGIDPNRWLIEEGLERELGRDAARIKKLHFSYIERVINGLSAEERLRIRQEQSDPLVAELEEWLRDERSRLSRSASVAKPIDYMLRRWDRFSHFIDDGRVCLTNNAAERALRGFALGRKSWLFAGSERGAERAAAMTTLIMTAKLNDVDPLAWLANVLARIADTAQSRLAELLPWNWTTQSARLAA